MKIKFDGSKYLAFDESRNTWIRFWQEEDATILFGDMNRGDVIEIDDILPNGRTMVYFQNCGTSYPFNGHNTMCTGAYPNPSCGICQGNGVLTTIG